MIIASSEANKQSPISAKRREQILARIRADQANAPQRIEKMRQRQKVGLAIAKQAAEILKTEFNASRVALFGSLLTPEEMYDHSDIDIAVWGLEKDQLFLAWSSLDRQIDFQGAFPYIDLVPVEIAFPHIQESIEKAHLNL